MTFIVLVSLTVCLSLSLTVFVCVCACVHAKLGGWTRHSVATKPWRNIGQPGTSWPAALEGGATRWLVIQRSTPLY